MDQHLADFSSRRTALLSDLRSMLAASMAEEYGVPLRHLRISFDAPDLEPRRILEGLPAEMPAMFWARPEQAFSFLGIGSAAAIRATGERRFEEVSSGVDRLVKCTLSLNLSSLKDSDLPFMTGGYSFGPFNIAPEWREFGSCRFDVPEMLCTKLGSASVLTLVMPLHKDEGQAQNEALDVLSTRAALEIESAMHRLHAFMRVSTEEHDTETATGLPDLPQPPPRSSSFKRLVADEASRKAWTAKVESALDLIRRKAFDKIVLARELRMAIPGGAPAAATGMLDYLIEAFPDCSIFLKRTDSRACFIGASPERLIKAGNGTLTTDALAGSISRGMDEQEDRRLAERLLTDEKENLEHQFVVRQITQTLSDLADSISHPSTPVIKKLRNLQHLHTPITAKAANGIHLHGILEQLHPTPAVGGYPRRQAVPHIRNIEQIDRGWYSGIVGWQGMGQDGDFAVAIRSALLSGTTARLFAGCGIVASSDPEMEWQETCLKAAPLADALESAVRKTQ